MTATRAVEGLATLPSTSTADGFTALLGMGLVVVAAAFLFILRRRAT